MFGKVIGYALDKDGKLIGTPNGNPILKTLLYDVLFEDESVESYEANVIAENIWWSVVNDGHYEDYLQRIIDHRINYIVSYV